MQRPKTIEHPVRDMVGMSAETATAVRDCRLECRLATELTEFVSRDGH